MTGEESSDVTWREAYVHCPTKLLEYLVAGAPAVADYPSGKAFAPYWVLITCRWDRGDWAPVSVAVWDAGRNLTELFPVVAGRPEWLSRLLEDAMAGIRRTSIVTEQG